jgi:methanogenic corrinoid protein MtbC1
MRLEDTTSIRWVCDAGDAALPGGPSAYLPSRPPRPALTGEPRAAQLVRAIEAEIVPRLVMARGTATRSPALRGREQPATVERAEVDQLVRLLLAHDSTVASAYVHVLAHRGIPLDTLCLQLLAPAARRLGEMWEEDLSDFTEVTVGLCRLQSVLREISLEQRSDADVREQRPSILLVPSPGEQHMFGLLLVAEFFRRDGWSVCSEFPRTQAELVDLLSRREFDFVGLSVTRTEFLEGLAERIAAVRQSSRNRSIRVLLGGRVFAEEPAWAMEVGADAVASDGREAVEVASRLRSLPSHSD